MRSILRVLPGVALSALPTVYSAPTSMTNDAQHISLNVPLELYSTVRPIDGSWQSFSIEFSYMEDFFGNNSSPNTLTHNVLANLYERSGTNVIIRAGGSTANNVTFDPDLPYAIENFFEGSINSGLTGAQTDQPSGSIIGPAWFQTFETAPEGTKYIYCLTYQDNSPEGLEATVTTAKLALDRIGSDLYAFELSNEIEPWGEDGYRGEGWSPEVYTDEYLKYANIFDERVFANASQEPFFQMGALMGSGNASTNQPWNSPVILDLGINRNGQIKAASQHDYHGSNCDSTTEIAELRQNLLNHTNIVNRGTPHRSMAPVVDGYGVEYVLGETNSISCQGRDNVSNVFGSALWYLDYNLYIASRVPAVAKMYFHMGTPYRYSLWAPFDGVGEDDTALIRPSYYGALALAEGIGGASGRKQVHAVMEEETLVAYALYEPGEVFEGGKLDGLFIVNMEPFNSTQAAAGEERPYIQFEIPEGITAEATVKRLTAPGSEVKSGVTWGGQVVSDEGMVEGEETVEHWAPGNPISVGYAEAVLVSFGQ